MSQPNAAASNEDFEFAALAEAKNYRRALLREFSLFLRGDVIEIGAGIGQMTAELSAIAAIRRLLPIEPSAEHCAKHRENHPEFPALEGYIDDVDKATAWDAIFSVNVLEHIEHDREELCKYAALLREKRGTLCLFVPARPEIYAPIDKDFGHFRRYTKADLRQKLAAAGFEIARLDYFNFVGYFAWWLNFCLLKKRSFEVDKVRLYDRGIFPMVHWLESHILRPPLGQSLLAIARPL
ncbi:MAG: methyltransferase domain-containing protein [Verrucomicrobiota bacterium]